MGKLRKVCLTRAELLDVLTAYGAALQPRKGTSHVKYHCWVRGQKKSVIVDESINEFCPHSHTALWFIVLKQLGVSWEEFYAADSAVARRAGIEHRLPETGRAPA